MSDDDAIDLSPTGKPSATPVRAPGRSDVRHHIAASEIPPLTQDLVTRVVRATRLWRREQIAVADELIAHVADALATGESPETVVARFGDERTAARLIRRAMRRKRPLAWHILHGIGLIIGSLVVLYLALGIAFFLGRPTVKVDYLAEMNAGIETVPAEERAWTFYRAALLSMTEEPPLPTLIGATYLLDARPGDETWSELVKWLSDNEKAIDLARQGGAQRELGFVLGPEGSAIDAELWPNITPTSGPLPNVFLPHLSQVRLLANALRADARLAIEQRNTPRAMADIEALMGMSEQFRGRGLLVPQLVGLGIADVAFHAIEYALLRGADDFTDDDLKRLAHRLAAPARPSDFVNLQGERMAFADVVQRIYTDDGAGDGRITPEGIFLMRDPMVHSPPTQDERLVGYAFGPPAVGLMASRQDLLREHDRLMDEAERFLDAPLFRYDPDDYARVELQWRESQVNQWRYLPLALWQLSFVQSKISTERAVGRRDGLLVAIALESYRRRHGSYPQSLDVLTPELLPEVPIDRVTGKAVLFRLVNGAPLVYSRGRDGDDDQGRLPSSARYLRGEAWRSIWAPVEWRRFPGEPQTIADGDWILYPQPSVNE